MAHPTTEITNPNSSSRLLAYIGAFVAVSIWGASFISTKVLLQNDLNPVEIYIYRVLLAYILVFIVCPRPLWSHSLADEVKFILIGICGGSIYFIAENMAAQYTLVSNVSLIVTTAPLITVMLLAVIYRSQRISRSVWIGSVIALCGVGCVVFNTSVVLKFNPLGDILSLIAAIVWAVYTILLRPLSATYSTWFITRKTFIYGLITALPLMMMEPTHASWSMLMQSTVLLNLLFLGIFASMLSYLLWAMAVKKLGPIMASNFLYLQPVVTLILSGIILHEPVSVIGYTGCALILLGVWLSEKFRS